MPQHLLQLKYLPNYVWPRMGHLLYSSQSECSTICTRFGFEKILFLKRTLFTRDTFVYWCKDHLRLPNMLMLLKPFFFYLNSAGLSVFLCCFYCCTLTNKMQYRKNCHLSFSLETKINKLLENPSWVNREVNQ